MGIVCYKQIYPFVCAEFNMLSKETRAFLFKYILQIVVLYCICIYLLIYFCKLSWGEADLIRTPTYGQKGCSSFQSSVGQHTSIHNQSLAISVIQLYY